MILVNETPVMMNNKRKRKRSIALISIVAKTEIEKYIKIELS